MGRGYFLGKRLPSSNVHVRAPLTHNIQAGDGSRQPSQKELDLAKLQGEAFYGHVSKVNFA